MSAVLAPDERRTRLSNRRVCHRFDLEFRQIGYAVTVGLHTSIEGSQIFVGPIGEVFISSHKAGSDVTDLARDAAVTISLALQYEVPIQTLAAAITRAEDGSAASLAGLVIDRLIQFEAGEGAP